jgi:hypothetical protein
MNDFEDRPAWEQTGPMPGGGQLHTAVHRHRERPTELEIRVTVLPSRESWEPAPAPRSPFLRLGIDVYQIVADLCERVTLRVLEPQLEQLRTQMLAQLPAAGREEAVERVLAEARRQFTLEVKRALEQEGL